MATVSDFIEALKGKLAQSPSMKGITATYQFVLEGEGGGNYYAEFTDGAGVIHEGLAEKPSITITMSADNFISIQEGKLAAMPAFMTGKIKVKGDISLAMKLQGIMGK
ncbi:MAG: SCP2 sterol-binding domain-containing protein [Bacillota bacterium]